MFGIKLDNNSGMYYATQIKSLGDVDGKYITVFNDDDSWITKLCWVFLSETSAQEKAKELNSL